MWSCRRCHGGIALALAVVAMHEPARAQPESLANEVTRLPPLSLQLDGCPASWRIAIEPLLKLELDVLARERQLAEPPEITSIDLACDSDVVRVRVVIEPDEMGTTVDTTTVEANAVGRTIALKAAELVDALWSQTGTEPPPPPAPSSAIEPLAPEPRPPKRAATAELGPVAVVAGQPVGAFLGGRLGLALPLRSHFAVSVQASGVGGRLGTSPAPVNAVLGSLGAHVLVGKAAGSDWRWGIGPGGSLGWARLRGAPTDDAFESASLTALWGGPSLAARVSYGIGRLARVGIALDAGLFTLPAVGTIDDGDRVFALDGAWLASALTVGTDVTRR